VGLFSPRLLELPAVVVANKADAAADAAAALAELKRHTDLPIVPISASRRAGVERLKEALRRLAPPARPAARGATS
jgi:50S ribosomal subunit-associated GTPase HflX